MSRKIDPLDAAAFMRSVGFEPLQEYPGGNKPWKCICQKCSNELSPRYSDIKNKGHRCKYCAGIYVDPEFAREFMIESGYTPVEPYASNHKKWKAIHNACGRTVFPTYNNIRSGWGGCRSCAPNAPLNESEINEFMKAKALIPLEPFKNTHSNWKCMCANCGKIVSPTYTTLKHNGQGGCSYCAGKATDLADVIPNFRKAGFEPLEDFSMSNEPIKCRCLKCGEISFPRYKDVIRKGTGCKYCTADQFDYKEPSYFYIAFNKELDSIKVGISNDKAKTNRLEDHKKNGWQTVKTYQFEKGVDASNFETAILRWLRKTKLLPKHLLKEQMPQGGHSETVDAQEISCLEVQNYADKFFNEYVPENLR